MADGASHPRPPAPATNAVLRLLADTLGGGALVLLAKHRGEGRLEIEDAWPRPDLAGGRMHAPPDLFSGAPAVVGTAGIRIPIDWTEACGSRPAVLVAAPVAKAPSLYIVAASGGAAQPALPPIEAAAEIVGHLRDAGQVTRRERDTSERIAALVDSLPAPLVFVDSREIQVFLNDRARGLLGLPPGDSREQATAKALAQLVAGADGAQLQRLADDPAAALTFDITHRDRAYKVETRWLQGAHLSGRLWLFSDTTAEKALQDRLLDLTRLLQLTVKNVSEGVILVDPDFRVRLWNEPLLDLFGCPAEVVFDGADFRDLIRLTAERGELGTLTSEAAVALLQRRTETAPADRQEIQLRDGRILALRRTMLAGGRFMLAARDVTDERQAARLKDELVSTVSHELRTPLTSIAGSLGLLEGGLAGSLPPRAQELVAIAHRNSNRLARLVDDLLDMNKLHAGNTQFKFARVDLAALVAEAIENIQPYADRLDIRVEFAPPAEPVAALVDPDRISQVMSNLLSNAAKFSPRGSAVRVVLSAGQDRARIAVIDRGRGISPEFRRRLFTRFAQEDGSSARGQAGTGLGLAISKSIVEAHGGTIEADSISGVGTTFWVDLPLGGASGA